MGCMIGFRGVSIKRVDVEDKSWHQLFSRVADCQGRKYLITEQRVGTCRSIVPHSAINAAGTVRDSRPRPQTNMGFMDDGAAGLLVQLAKRALGDKSGIPVFTLTT